MAVWLWQRTGIILTLLFRISHCEYDLLENLQPKRNDPPELTDFLKSVLHKKDEFKKIREAARHLRIHHSPIDEDVFLNDQDDLSTKPRSSNLKHLNRNYKYPTYPTSNIHHPLHRRSGILDRPINDVYPYMYDENLKEVEPDEREERSSWKDVKERKHKHRTQRNVKRYRRGLDLTDYSSDNDLERGNIKVFPRSRIGFRVVPGNKYQQRRETVKRRRKFSDEESISEILGSSPFTQRAIPDDGSADHDILGFKAESEISAQNTDNKNSENTVQEMNRRKTNERTKRSMKLNIIDDNNLITKIRQDNSAKSIILTLKGSQDKKQDIQRETATTLPPVIPDFESLHKALHFGCPFLKIHENPSNAIDIIKSQEVEPDISIELNRQNEKDDDKKNQDIIKQNGVPVVYQLDEDNEKVNQDEHSDQKNMLQDVDEPTSALEQYELSTKPYVVGVPRSEDMLSSHGILKKVTELYEPADSTTTAKNKHFNVKETKDMVHGKNKKGFLFVGKRASGITSKTNKQKEERELPRNDNSPQTNLNSLDVHGSSEEINEQNIKNDYFDQSQQEIEPQNAILLRKLLSLNENSPKNADDRFEDTPYGFLDYENGRVNRMMEPGFTRNKIRVKRDLTDLFGMNKDEEYAEDLLDDYNPPVKQERSDYTYEEEGDSAVPEKQKYNKKKNKEKESDKHQNTENNNRDLATSEPTPGVLFENPTSAGSSNPTSETNEVKTSRPKENYKNLDSTKKNVHANLNHNHNSPTNKVRREAECNNCKHTEDTKAKNNKCDNCKPGSENDGNCKNCNKNKQKASKAGTNVFEDKPEEKLIADNQNLEQKEQPALGSVQIRSNAAALGCDKNETFHPKTALNNNTSTEENKKPPKEEANSDAAEYKFSGTKNTTDLCGPEKTNSTKPHDIIKNSSVQENPLEKPSNKNNIKSDAGEEEGTAIENDYGETVGFAHHPLKSKNAYNINENVEYTSDPKPKMDGVLTQFHSKHDENEFSQNDAKPEREETPDVETTANRNDEANFQKLFRENHNQMAENNEDFKAEKISDKENDDDNELFRLTEANRNEEIGRKRKDTFRRNIIDKALNRINRKQSPKTKQRPNNLILNSVNNFADVEEEAANKKVNKRQTNAQKNRGLSKIKGKYDGDLDNPEIDRYTYDVPFEKLKKSNQGYWRKPSGRVIQKRPSHAHQPYSNEELDQSQVNERRIASKQNNFKQYLNYRNRFPSELRRIRRDQNDYDNLERRDASNIIPHPANRNTRNKGECTDLHDKHGPKHKAGMKEWLNPKGPKSNRKQCLLGQDKGLNPSFGLKPSKGSCNDEAELERGSKDYGQLHDALNGHLASLVVETTFKRIKEHAQLKNRFSHGLTRQHGFKNEMKDLNAFRNNETESDVKHTEDMLHQIMIVLNKIILDQVRRRTCKHLSPDLQKYLAVITKPIKRPVDEETKISEEGFPLPLVKEGKHKERPIDTEQGDFLFSNPQNKPELETDEEEIRKKMKMIKELLNKYKHMSGQCKTKVEDVEEYLKKHLCLLKKMLKEIKKQRGSQAGNAERLSMSNKLKRKNYEAPPVFGFSNYNPYIKTDLINKQLDSVGLGSGRTYKPAFNLNKFIEDAKYKIKYKKIHEKNPSVSTKQAAISNSKSGYRNEDNMFLEEDYDNPKKEHKREIDKNRQVLSEKYKKLVQAAESLRKKREIEDRLGKLFGKPEKRSIRNENYESIKSLNKHHQDYSRVGFEKPVVFSFKK